MAAVLKEAFPRVGESGTPRAGGDKGPGFTHRDGMATTVDFIRQAGPIEWLLTPSVLVTGLVLFVLILSGLPGRIVLEVESIAHMRRMRRR